MGVLSQVVGLEDWEELSEAFGHVMNVDEAFSSKKNYVECSRIEDGEGSNKSTLMENTAVVKKRGHRCGRLYIFAGLC